MSRKFRGKGEEGDITSFPVSKFSGGPMHGRSSHATMSDSMSINLVKLEDLFRVQHSSKRTRFEHTFRIDSPW